MRCIEFLELIIVISKLIFNKLIFCSATIVSYQATNYKYTKLFVKYVRIECFYVGHTKYCGPWITYWHHRHLKQLSSILKQMNVYDTHRLCWSHSYHRVTYRAFSISQYMFIFIYLKNNRQREWKKKFIWLFSLSHTITHANKQIIWVIQCITCQVILATRFVHWWKWYAHFINSVCVLLFINVCL